MIFISTGSQKFQFNRLLEAVDGLVASGRITDTVFAQTGYSTYQPKHYEYQAFLDREQFENKIDEADIVITHGGTGSIMSAIVRGKKVIAVPRKKQYGEHVDDHQIQIIEQFVQSNLICACDDPAKLDEAIIIARNTEFADCESNNRRIIEDIASYLSSI